MNRFEQKRDFADFFGSFLPNNCDNLKQIIIKCLYLAAVLTIAISGMYMGDYFISAQKEKDILGEYRDCWYSGNWVNSTELIKERNSDFSGWLKFNGTDIDHPVFQTDNNSFYMNHNADKKKSGNGSLMFDCDNKISENKTDKNLVIYGRANRGGGVFGNLKKLRNISFFRKNSTLELSLLDKTDTYSIYAVFVLNASKEDDGGYIYNIYRQNFLNQTDFDNWVNEAKERSVINTEIDVNEEDNILTLVTDCDDFPNARLVVMAKSTNDDKNADSANNNAHANPQARYPQKWYTQRGIKS